MNTKEYSTSFLFLLGLLTLLLFSPLAQYCEIGSHLSSVVFLSRAMLCNSAAILIFLLGLLTHLLFSPLAQYCTFGSHLRSIVFLSRAMLCNSAAILIAIFSNNSPIIHCDDVTSCTIVYNMLLTVQTI